MASALSRARASAANLRARRKEERQDLLERAATIGGAGVLGVLHRRGTLDGLPTIAGMPPVATAALVSAVVGTFVGGTAGTLLAGLGDGGLAVAAYQWGSGEPVSGAGPADDIAAMERQLAELGTGTVAGDGPASVDEVVEGEPVDAEYVAA